MTVGQLREKLLLDFPDWKELRFDIENCSTIALFGAKVQEEFDIDKIEAKGDYVLITLKDL